MDLIIFLLMFAFVGVPIFLTGINHTNKRIENDERSIKESIETIRKAIKIVETQPSDISEILSLFDNSVSNLKKTSCSRKEIAKVIFDYSKSILNLSLDRRHPDIDLAIFSYNHCMESVKQLQDDKNNYLGFIVNDTQRVISAIEHCSRDVKRDLSRLDNANKWSLTSQGFVFRP